jgi:hypothetical protein
MRKKAQSWTIEFILALLIFSSAIVLSVKYVSNIYRSDDFQNIMKESEVLSDYLLTEGTPTNWTYQDFIRPGLTLSGKIDTAKLSNLTAINYTIARSAFGTNYDFYMFFEDDDGIIDIFGEATGIPGLCGYGSPKMNVTYNGICNVFLEYPHENLITIKRLAVYNHSAVSLVIYLWN